MMLTDRLRDCFTAVFPTLDPSEIEHATTSTLDAWDSLATVRLVAVIEEEFGIELDLEELEQLNSFRSIEKLLEDKVSA